MSGSWTVRSRRPTAMSWLRSGGELTIKRLRLEHGHVRLAAENPPLKSSQDLPLTVSVSGLLRATFTASSKGSQHSFRNFLEQAASAAHAGAARWSAEILAMPAFLTIELKAAERRPCTFAIVFDVNPLAWMLLIQATMSLFSTSVASSCPRVFSMWHLRFPLYRRTVYPFCAREQTNVVVNHARDRVLSIETINGIRQGSIRVVAMCPDEGQQELGALVRVHLLSHPYLGVRVVPPDIVRNGTVLSFSCLYVFHKPLCGDPTSRGWTHKKAPGIQWIPGALPFVRGGGLEPPPPFED